MFIFLDKEPYRADKDTLCYGVFLKLSDGSYRSPFAKAPLITGKQKAKNLFHSDKGSGHKFFKQPGFHRFLSSTAAAILMYDLELQSPQAEYHIIKSIIPKNTIINGGYTYFLKCRLKAVFVKTLIQTDEEIEVDGFAKETINDLCLYNGIKKGKD